MASRYQQSEVFGLVRGLVQVQEDVFGFGDCASGVLLVAVRNVVAFQKLFHLFDGFANFVKCGVQFLLVVGGDLFCHDLWVLDLALQAGVGVSMIYATKIGKKSIQVKPFFQIFFGGIY